MREKTGGLFRDARASWPGVASDERLCGESRGCVEGCGLVEQVRVGCTMSLAIRGLLCKCRRQKPSARFSGGGGRNDQQSPPPTPFSWHLEEASRRWELRYLTLACLGTLVRINVVVLQPLTILILLCSSP